MKKPTRKQVTAQATLNDYIDLGETLNDFIDFSVRGTIKYDVKDSKTMDLTPGNTSHEAFLQKIESAYGTDLSAVNVVSIVELKVASPGSGITKINNLKCENKTPAESNGIVITVPYPFPGIGGTITFIHKPKRTTGKVSNHQG